MSQHFIHNLQTLVAWQLSLDICIFFYNLDWISNKKKIKHKIHQNFK